MTSKEIIDILNTAPTVGMIFCIAAALFLLLAKKESSSKPKSSKR